MPRAPTFLVVHLLITRLAFKGKMLKTDQDSSSGFYIYKKKVLGEFVITWVSCKINCIIIFRIIITFDFKFDELRLSMLMLNIVKLICQTFVHSLVVATTLQSLVCILICY